MLQGLLGTATGFLQAVPLAKYYVKTTLFGSTPRSVYSLKYSPRTSNLGTLFPSMTLLVVITFGYSVICPIINGFAFVTFFLLYMLYKYHFTWVNDHSPSSDTGGLFFPKSIHHVFVGLYLQQLCLCALFFLPLSSNTPRSAIPEGVLMIVLIVFTVSIVNIRTLDSFPLMSGPGIFPPHHPQFLWPSRQVPASDTCQSIARRQIKSRAGEAYDCGCATADSGL